MPATRPRLPAPAINPPPRAAPAERQHRATQRHDQRTGAEQLLRHLREPAGEHHAPRHGGLAAIAAAGREAAEPPGDVPERNAGRERIYLKDKEPLLLEPRDPVLYHIQKLRDEAHRFAIGAHRAKRKKTITASPLDEVRGIGPRRKRALLQHFGSAKAVSRAGIADLEAVDGISAQMARTIYDYFDERG